MIRIYTDKYELDVLDTDISIFKEILDRESIANRSSSWTREISLPNTDNNNEFFETVYKLDIVTNRFTKGKRVKCTITDGTNILLEGSLQLINSKTVNQHTTYQVIFTGQLIDLMKGLDEFYLNMLDLSEYDHVRNWNNIRDSWDFKIQKNGQTVVAKEGYVYPDIIYGENGMDGDKYFYDYYPATNVKTLVDKIFELTGVKYKSKFFESDYFKSIYMPFSNDKLNEDEDVISNRTSIRSFNPNFQPVADSNGWNALTTRQKQNTPQHSVYFNRDLQLPYNLNVWNYSFFNDKVGIIQQDVQLKDNNDQIIADTFTCQAQGEYNINISIPIVPKITTEGISNVQAQYLGGNLDFRWIVYLKRNNGQSEILERNMQPTTYNVDGIMHFTLSDSHVRTDADFPWYDMDTRLDINYNGTKFLDVGDRIFIEIYFRHPVTQWAVYSGGNSVSSNHMRVELVSRRNIGDMFAKFEVKPSSNQGYGNEHISLANTLPDVTAKDFLMSIIQTFNLIVDVDPSSTIEDPVFIIETFDEYHKNGRIITDWELAEDSEFKQIYNDDIREYYLSYTEDVDYLNEHFMENNNQRIYGDFKLYTTDEMSDKVDKLDLIFAPTINSNIRSKNKIVPYLCKFKDEKFVANKTKPRLLFYNGVKYCNQYKVFLKPNLVISTENVYPYVGMWDDPYNPKYTLEFNNSSKLYYDTNGVPQFNLNNQFHQNLKGRVSEEYRIVEGEFYLTPNQFAEHKFSDKILIDNQLYRVLLIDNYTYDVEESLTKVILEKIVDENYPPIQIEGSSCPTDLKLVRTTKGIRFESKNGVINEDCCIERGGVWNSNTKTCSIPWGRVEESIKPADVVAPVGPPKPVPGVISPIIKLPYIKLPADNEGNSSTGGIIDGGFNESISKYKINSVYITDGTYNDAMNTGSVIPDVLLIDGNESITVYSTGIEERLLPLDAMRPNS